MTSISHVDSSAIPDTTLIASHLRGDEEAFEILVHRYQHRLVNYLYTLLRDRDEASGLAQEAFLRVYQNAHRCRLDARFSAWIYRIATNLAIDELRRRRKRPIWSTLGVAREEPGDPVVSDGGLTPEKALTRKERLQSLRTAIHSLPTRYRLPFLLAEVEELSYQETAQVLGISVGTVKSRLHRAKGLLREKLAALL